MFIIIIIGLITGFSAGALGIGGAVLGTPLLKIIANFPDYLALAPPLPAVVPAAISGAIAYSKQKLLRLEVAKHSLIFAIPFSILGSYITKFTPSYLLMIITGLLLIQSGFSFIKKGFFSSEIQVLNVSPKININKNAIFLSGIVAGFLSGFLAVGGGIIFVPSFMKFCNLSLKESLATSLFCVAVLAIPGIITHSFLGHIDWNAALILAASVIPASYIGATFSSKLKNNTISRYYGIFILLFAFIFIYNSLINIK